MYYVIIAITIAVVCAIVFGIRKLIGKANSETNISTNMITAGISLLVSAFPGTKETVLSIIGKLVDAPQEVSTDYAALICGAILIIGGIAYRINIKDRIFVLNMFGIPVQREISDEGNIKDLHLADFKVKEILVDFVDVFDVHMTDKINTIIVKKINKVCTAFFNRSKDYKSCFTGMAPIPYTILAGTFLSGGKVRRFFEYRRIDSRYYELKRKSRKHYDELSMELPGTLHQSLKEIVVSLSVTKKINKNDLVQFQGKDIVEISLPTPADNIIETIKQLDEYTTYILNEIEGLKNSYPNLKKIHFVASIPSCLSLELGKKFALNSHRLSQIISYHFVNTENPKYPFGIIVADGNAENIGKLVN